MDSQEANDIVSPMHNQTRSATDTGVDHTKLNLTFVGSIEDLTTSFRQIDYVWLFDPDLNFKERPGFKLDESSLTNEDF
jgi:hypothetical protein